MGTESASLETKVRLQQCAVCEFMEKGFLKASLRSICREAGVTTGALYFFFQDKDDLFVNDGIHLTESGCKAYATLLYNNILNNINTDN